MAAMKKIQYRGPHDQVEIEVAPALWVTVARGDTVEIPAKIAAALLTQTDNWVDPTVDEKPAPEEKR